MSNPAFGNWTKPGTIRLLLMLCICSALFPIATFSQTSNPALAGTLKGKVKDSVYNFVLTGATVAVYRDADSMLLQFTLANDLGEFTSTPLPVEILLRLTITHVGYSPYIRKFRLRKDSVCANLGLLYMHQYTDKEANTLNEVVVKSSPPMRMNGDTVEFNAAAFRMAPNVTAEDWMRVLPGFTVWGDGEITYNGKKITAIYVEGKRFMASDDPTIATQNLPKETLDKLQVYQQQNVNNPLDSTLFANIKLKDNKKTGYFGKLSGGYGTDGRYAADGMLSGFNKKLQVNTIGALNNINKLATNIDMLMKNSSFKGEGVNMDYQSDFGMRGLNKPAAAGVKLQYDFIPDAYFQKARRLNADYLLNDNHTLVNNSSLVNNFLAADTVLSRRSVNASQSQSLDQKANGYYVWQATNMDVFIVASFSQRHDKNMDEDVSEQQKTGLGIISNSFSHSEQENVKKTMAAGFGFTNRGYNRSYRKRHSSAFTLGYHFTATEDNGSSRNQTQYVSAAGANDNRYFNRLYEQRDVRRTAHSIDFSYPDLTRMIFNRRSLGGIQMQLFTTLAFNNDDYANRVLDMDTVSKRYHLNAYLTNTRNAVTRDIQPMLSVSKRFEMNLTNRYNKWVSVTARLRNQFFTMDHKASLAVQNFSRQYSFFIPDAIVEYNNHQYGTSEATYTLSFSTAVTYPDVNHIAPLIDSSNLWEIPMGNPHIKPQYKKELAVAYKWSTRTPKNPLSFQVKIAAGKIDYNIIDSSFYDEAGVRTSYAVNVNGARYANGEYRIKKSYEIKKNTTLEANGLYTISVSRTPQYVNGTLNLSKSTDQNMVIYLGFRHKDILNIKAEQGYRLYHSRQDGFNNKQFKSANSYSRLIGTWQYPKNLVWGSNITYNKSSSNSGSPAYFTIWNASLTWRFLKASNGEVKFAAFDLLRQNKGVVNTAAGNAQTFTSSNMLQRYYILTLSYYPRKFWGKEN